MLDKGALYSKVKVRHVHVISKGDGERTGEALLFSCCPATENSGNMYDGKNVWGFFGGYSLCCIDCK